MSLKKEYIIVNSLTIYRLVMAPVLVVLIIYNQVELFKWLLLVSFLTDALDGFLARRLNVASRTGAKLDSIADDLTVVAAMTAMVIVFHDFVLSNMVVFIIPFVLFLAELLIAFIKYKKISSFHTYLAKLAALLQGLFFISAFFLEIPHYGLFIITAVITTLDLIEEIIMVLIIKEWRANVHGLWWVLKANNK